LKRIDQPLGRVLQGDKVFGCLDTFFPYVREGCYAQYVAAKESQLALMPEGVSFEEAAGVPLVALTAWQVGLGLDSVSIAFMGGMQLKNWTPSAARPVGVLVMSCQVQVGWAPVLSC
jgi:hypothetical protein